MRIRKSAQNGKKSKKGILSLGLLGIILTIAGYFAFKNYKNQTEPQPKVLNIIRLPL